LTFAKHLHSYFYKPGKGINCNKIKGTQITWIKFSPSASNQIGYKPPEKERFVVIL